MTCKELIKEIGIDYITISRYLNDLGFQPALSKRYSPRIVSHASKANCPLLRERLVKVAEAHSEKLKSLSQDDNTVYFLTYAVVDAMTENEFYNKAQIREKVQRLKLMLL